MASADDPAVAAAAHIFNEDEDILDDDDDVESSDHDEDDSVSSAAFAVDRPPPSTSLAQVTIAVPGVPDPHLRPHQQLQETIINKKPAQQDESRKLFQRLWTDQDEIELLQGFLDYTTQRCGPHNSSQHHHDTAAFYDQIKSKFQLDFNKNQLVEKLRRLKKKYRNVIGKFGTGKEYVFKSPHDQATFEISSKIWGDTAVNFNGSSTFRASTAPIEEDEDDLNLPNFADYQSPKPSGIDVNSKTPRPRKRDRVGAVKVEEKQHHAVNSNINSTQPSVTVTPIAAPVISMGISGSIASVIEETVKSCLSPIFKELLGHSMSSIPNPNGPCCGHGFGFGLAQSPIPLCFTRATSGDKMGSDRWRNQQILELEVFSKRLELVQDEIREQLQGLRSMGN